MLTSQKIKELLTTEDIIKLCCHLQGNDDYFMDSYGHPIFLTYLDHPNEGGNSWKEYYYPETKLFHVYTRGESYDIFELVKRAKNLETFKEAFDYVVNFFNLKNQESGNNIEEELVDDWDIFQKYDDYQAITNNILKETPIIQENILEYFTPAYPTEWIKDGITPEVMSYFDIRIDSALSKIIIPHRTLDGRLCGIRGRSFDPKELDEGKKYMPVYIEGKCYRHELGQHLFGLYQNRKCIQRYKKVLICESEKAVMQCASMYGINNNFCVATCGSSLSQFQINLLIELGVQEVIYAPDHDVIFSSHDAPETVAFEQKEMKILQKLTPYFNTYVIMDYDNLTPQKATCTDCGKEILETLMKKKIHITTINN